jgi:hypothetical protein
MISIIHKFRTLWELDKEINKSKEFGNPWCEYSTSVNPVTKAKRNSS